MGPTGSGKTELACRLDPERFEILSCDSRQVYRELEVGTAAPLPEERDLIRHHMVGILNPDEFMSAGIFRERAIPILRDIFKRNKTPVLVGGTGFYYRALRTGMFQIDVPESIRREIHELTLEERRSRLADLDPDLLWPADSGMHPPGKIHVNDEYRIGRALEVSLATGIPWSEHWRRARQKGDQDSEFRFRGWRLVVERESYWKRLEERSEKIIQAGFVEEARRVMERYGDDCQGLKTLGYNYALQVIRGEMPGSELGAALTICHRQYGKRQRTWFNREDSLVPIPPSELLKKLETPGVGEN